MKTTDRNGRTGHQTGGEKLSLRVNDANENHHLWNNNGTWWVHYTLHLADFTKKRVRTSLRTQSLSEARRLRDQILAEVGQSTPELLAA